MEFKFIKKEGGVEMIKVTKSAADKFNEIRKDSENPEKAMLRVSFGGYG